MLTVGFTENLPYFSKVRFLLSFQSLRVKFMSKPMREVHCLISASGLVKSLLNLRSQQAEETDQNGKMSKSFEFAPYNRVFRSSSLWSYRGGPCHLFQLQICTIYRRSFTSLCNFNPCPLYLLLAFSRSINPCWKIHIMGRQ